MWFSSQTDKLGGSSTHKILLKEAYYYERFINHGIQQMVKGGSFSIPSIFVSSYFIIALRELSSYHHISKKILWKYYHVTISIWSPTNSGVKISVSLKGFWICNNIGTPCWGFGSLRPVCLKKAQHLEVFYSSPFWNLNFEISKFNFL